MKNKQNKIRSIAVLALLLSLVVLPMNTNATAVDNTLNFTGVFALTNPCNGELLGPGPIDIYIVVSTAETGNGAIKVNVHHNSHATMIGNQGNEYQLNRRAKGQFDAISNQYVIEWWAEVIGKEQLQTLTPTGPSG